jgi:hypothetical protein
MIKSKTMRRTVFVLIISALISCKNNSKENTSGVIESISTIEVLVSQNDLQIANKNVEPNYIFLEQRDKNSAIADISKLIYFDDKIIILDKQSNKVFLFDNSGNFISEIGRAGKGPGEFLRVSDILISKPDSCIELLDAGSQKILRMDKQFNYFTSINLPFFCQNFHKSIQGEYWFFTNNQANTSKDTKESFNIIKADENVENLSFFIPIQEHMKDLVIATPYSFTNSVNASIFALPLENTLYSIHNDTVTRKYVIDFGENNLPLKYIEPLKKIETTNFPERFNILNQINKTDYAYMIHSVFETDHHVYFQFQRDKKVYGTLLNKDDWQYKTGIIPPLFGQPVYFTNNQISTVIYPHNLSGVASDSSKGELELLLSKVRENDNPIIKQIMIE